MTPISFAPVEYCEFQVAQTVDLWHFAYENALSESGDQFNPLCHVVPV